MDVIDIDTPSTNLENLVEQKQRMSRYLKQTLIVAQQ